MWYDFHEVALIPSTAAGACADAEAAGYVPTTAKGCCRESSDVLVADDGSRHYVGVLRGDTALVAVFRARIFDDEAVTEALRSAPRSDADELSNL